MKHSTSLLIALLIAIAAIAIKFNLDKHHAQSVAESPILKPATEKVTRLNQTTPISHSNRSDELEAMNETPSNTTHHHLAIENPYPYIGATTGALTDLSGTFETHIEAAMDGEPESQMIVGYTVHNCAMVDSLETEEKLDALLAEHEIPAAYELTMRKLIPECAPVFRAKPTGKALSDWSWELLQAASDGGNLVAQLEVKMRKNTTSMEEASALLAEAVHTNDYRAYYKVSEFYANFYPQYSHSNFTTEVKAWDLVACRHHDACSEETMEKNLQLQLLPAEIEQVAAVADQIQAKIDSQASFTFNDPNITY